MTGAMLFNNAAVTVEIQAERFFVQRTFVC
jgi:hypothetical protein